MTFVIPLYLVRFSQTSATLLNCNSEPAPPKRRGTIAQSAPAAPRETAHDAPLASEHGSLLRRRADRVRPRHGTRGGSRVAGREPVPLLQARKLVRASRSGVQG